MAGATREVGAALVEALSNELEWAEGRSSVDGGALTLINAVQATIDSEEGTAFADRLCESFYHPKHILALPDDFCKILKAHFLSTEPPLIEEETIDDLQKALHASLRTGAKKERDKAYAQLIGIANNLIANVTNTADKFRLARILMRMIDQYSVPLLDAAYSEVGKETRAYLPPQEDAVQQITAFNNNMKQHISSGMWLLGVCDDHRWAVWGVVGGTVALGVLAYWKVRSTST